jgi:hypothetical protein
VQVINMNLILQKDQLKNQKSILESTLDDHWSYHQIRISMSWYLQINLIFLSLLNRKNADPAQQQNV